LAKSGEAIKFRKDLLSNHFQILSCMYWRSFANESSFLWWNFQKPIYGGFSFPNAQSIL